MADGTVKCIDNEIPFQTPSGWEWERWGNISHSIQYGYNAPAQDAGNARMVRISDIQDNQVLWDTVPYCNIKEEEIDSYLLAENDILFARTGGTVGKSFLVSAVPYKAIYAGYLIRTRYSRLLCPQYLKYFMESQLYWDQLRNGTIATAQPNCNGKTLSRMILPIPPISEQRRIVDRLNNAMVPLERYSKGQNALDQLNLEIKEKLKKSILQEAIQGKLVPQIASEGDASILLQQIELEKQKLVKEGKLKKKDLVSSTIFRGDDNKYYEQIGESSFEIDVESIFPSSWTLVRLKDVCALTDGIKQEGDQIVLDAKYLRGKSSGDHCDRGKFVHKGEQIILVDGENSGEVFTVPCDGYMGSTFKQLWVSLNMDLQYVLYFILLHKDLLRNSKKGAAIPHLNKEVFYNLIIGLPPLPEQKRITKAITDTLKRLD